MSNQWLGRLIANLQGPNAKRRRKRFRAALRTRNRRSPQFGFEALEGRRLLVASLAINDPSIVEGNSGTSNLVFTVTRGGDDTLSNVTVAYNTSDNSPAAGAATSGSDYTSTSGTVTIPSGSTTATISVPVQGDTTGERDEQLFVNLTGVTNVTGPAVTLAAKQDQQSGLGPISVATGDFNGDGRPDLAIANYSENTVSILLNTTPPGSSTTAFAIKTEFNTGQKPTSISVADLNGDGKVDLVVANKFSGNVSVLLNNTIPGNLTPAFFSSTEFSTGTQPVSVAVGDLNGDGKPDLAVANRGSSSVSVLLNVTSPGASVAAFSANAAFTVASGPGSIAIGDLNGDGKPDLATVSNFSTNVVSVLLNTTIPGGGSATFSPKSEFLAGVGPVSVAIEDLNGDGRRDLVVANQGSLLRGLSVLLNTTTPGAGIASFSDLSYFAIGSGMNSVALADLNNDGKIDMAAVNNTANVVSVLLNTMQPGATVPTFATKADSVTGATPLSLAIADLNGDGKPDLITANIGDNSVSVLLNTTVLPTASVALGPKTDFTTGNLPTSVAIGDLNGDGKPDMAITNAHFSSNSVSVLLNTSNPGATVPTYTAKTDFNTGSRPTSVSMGDVNGDGKLDLVVADAFSNSVSIFLNSTTPGATTPTFAAATSFTTGSSPYSVAIGDINGDGKPDLAIANYISNSVSVLLNTTPTGATTATYSTKTDFATGTTPTSVVIGDLNGDGKPDLAIANANSNSVSVLLNSTTPGATLPVLSTKFDIPTGAAPHAVAFRDLNGDGNPDLITANKSSNSVSILLSTTTPGASVPSYAAKTDFNTGNSPYSVAIADMNGDGKPDLAIANYSSNSVSVLLNSTAPGATTPGFAAKTDFVTGNSPTFVAIGDLNGDGKLDLATADSGASSVSILLNQPATISDNQGIGTITNDDFDLVPPTVTAVYAAGSAWTRALIDAVDGGGTGTGNGLGYQLTPNFTIPNSSVDRIYIQFSEPVVGFNDASFALVGVNIANYAGVSSVSYDADNRRGVIALSSVITNDKFRVGVNSTVTDNAGNLLDGDMTSGAGGVFSLRFNVLVGDADGNANVNGGDLASFAAAFNQSAGSPNFDPRADWSSDGSINGADLAFFAASFNQSLPAGEPSAVLFSGVGAPGSVLAAPAVDAYFQKIGEREKLRLLDIPRLF